ncbi:hypothetical protein AB0D27_31070 [Streptomyces sp. NPDC048415]|jgi:hypothetical protein|uniref:hypothetical protein n=1 Tax=Streptomyces sp. NPDC048415 TaxID=3154822 RepID=UPI00343FA9B4
MNAQRARRLATLSAVGVLMAGGAAIGAAGTASAATPAQAPGNRCFDSRWWNDCDFGHGNRFDRGDLNRFDGGNGAVVVIVLG